MRLLANPTTGPTNALASIVGGVHVVKGVPLQAPVLTDVDGCDTDAPKDILTASHGFQMFGLNAVPNSAQMVEGQPLGYRPNEPFIGNAMSAGLPSVNYYQAVPFAVYIPIPQPAILTNVDIGEKALNPGLQRRQRVFAAPPCIIVLLAQTPSLIWPLAVKFATLSTHRKLVLSLLRPRSLTRHEGTSLPSIIFAGGR